MDAAVKKEIESLKKSLSRVQKDLQEIKDRLQQEFPHLEDVLRRRGIKIYHANPSDDFLLPLSQAAKYRKSFIITSIDIPFAFFCATLLPTGNLFPGIPSPNSVL